ncbi:MAG: UDP-N-acetylglucosamine 1-carboxyvinyltransferase [candidate division Zixibacteria bacterium]|nr:UDP-N-acetylglucosamine 1-carboxyvinyltransferase [candidate division Zixibacteria bacterium]
MDRFRIEGGRKLSGTVKIQSSKNAVLPILAASLLVEGGDTIMNNVPDLADVHVMLKVLERVGAKVERHADDKHGEAPSQSKVVINAQHLRSYEAPYDLVRKMRASFLVMGPLLARLGKAKVSLPGGCVLGPRPVNLHLAGFARLGAKVKEEHGYVLASSKRLSGNVVFFDRPSHTGTENILMTACLSQGQTTIVNAACDPEVADLARFLNLMGAKIKGAGNSTIQVEGVKKLKAVEYTPIPDRLDAATFMMAACITRGIVELKNVVPEHLRMVTLKLREMGAQIEEDRGRIKVKGPRKLKPLSVVTYPHPGFPTDMQASMMALTCIADGTSQIRETVFEERFTHAMELCRLGADIKISGDRATINGIPKLRGASVMASDIRGGAGLTLAGLAAEGNTEVLRVYHIDRGYDRMEERLAQLGASIKRIAS